MTTPARRQLRLGLIGGGRDSQIGRSHIIASGLDRCFRLTCGALDVDAAAGKAYAVELGVDENRAYGDWQEMLEKESRRDDRVDMVTIATPNATHFEIAHAFIAAGFHVLCEKPLTMTVEEALALNDRAKRDGKLLAVNFGYSGYPMVRQARAMVANGDLGKLRVIVAEFAHGFHADPDDADNPRVRWRYDPAEAGVSAVFADCGIHALHMASFIAGQSVTSLSADCVASVGGRVLEDDASVALRFSGGAVGRLWTSAVAVGQMHGLNIRVFGEKGGLRWSQELPNQLYFTPLNASTRIIERGTANLYDVAAQASRITIGHAEGMLIAFANLYRDTHAAITSAASDGELSVPDTLPSGRDGVMTTKAIHALARSRQHDGRWEAV